MKCEIVKLNFVTSWAWNARESTCGICKRSFDTCCSECTYPGEECPLTEGKCCHEFHMHCILKWINSSQSNSNQCPMCRQDWNFLA
ncbi:Anaphase-promoting complex subunit 11 [Intoshia linei]|uniref:Anaphase-promoting complex subunit 11 n=1 Tax=Intoshia linei TaxID=1819745 RepID=A0A177AWK0_9BILA|nr:Anaphase-promoting complex subunit 11 [Intoshia linei]